MGGAAAGAKVTTTKVDVSKDEEVVAWTSEVLSEFGRLDGAANVAGIAGGDGETTCATIVSASYKHRAWTKYGRKTKTGTGCWTSI